MEEEGRGDRAGADGKEGGRRLLVVAEGEGVAWSGLDAKTDAIAVVPGIGGVGLDGGDRGEGEEVSEALLLEGELRGVREVLKLAAAARAEVGAERGDFGGDGGAHARPI